MKFVDILRTLRDIFLEIWGRRFSLDVDLSPSERLQQIIDQLSGNEDMGEYELFSYDFLDAINAALEEADEIEGAHQEIWEILARVTDDVKDATDGKATFGLDVEDTRDLVEQDGHEARLVVRSVARDGVVYEREVGGFSSTVAGYPVTVGNDDLQWECDDSDELCDALDSICRETRFGRTLRVAMARTDKDKKSAKERAAAKQEDVVPPKASISLEKERDRLPGETGI